MVTVPRTTEIIVQAVPMSSVRASSGVPWKTSFYSNASRALAPVPGAISSSFDGNSHGGGVLKDDAKHSGRGSPPCGNPLPCFLRCSCSDARSVSSLDHGLGPFELEKDPLVTEGFLERPTQDIQGQPPLATNGPTAIQHLALNAGAQYWPGLRAHEEARHSTLFDSSNKRKA